jgi:hypothetical protein
MMSFDTRRQNVAITIAGTTGCLILPDLDQNADALQQNASV